MRQRPETFVFQLEQPGGIGERLSAAGKAHGLKGKGEHCKDYIDLIRVLRRTIVAAPFLPLCVPTDRSANDEQAKQTQNKGCHPARMHLQCPARNNQCT
jgi:hypothetical protein